MTVVERRGIVGSIGVRDSISNLLSSSAETYMGLILGEHERADYFRARLNCVRVLQDADIARIFGEVTEKLLGYRALAHLMSSPSGESAVLVGDRGNSHLMVVAEAVLNEAETDSERLDLVLSFKWAERKFGPSYDPMFPSEPNVNITLKGARPPEPNSKWHSSARWRYRQGIIHYISTHLGQLA